MPRYHQTSPSVPFVATLAQHIFNSFLTSSPFPFFCDITSPTRSVFLPHPSSVSIFHWNILIALHTEASDTVILFCEVYNLLQALLPVYENGLGQCTSSILLSALCHFQRLCFTDNTIFTIAPTVPMIVNAFTLDIAIVFVFFTSICTPCFHYVIGIIT